MAVVKKRAGKRSSEYLKNAPIIMGKARPAVVSTDGYDVYQAAVDRITWLFDEFDEKVSVSNSGGKDSTIVVELAAKINRERGNPPLRVVWLDQECEFQATVDYQRHLAYERDDIDFHWYQVPFELENATDLTDQFLNVWGIGEEWVRAKEPSRAEGGPSIWDNTYGQTRFYEVLAAISSQDWDGIILDGLRSEESPARRLTTTSAPMYKWCTWVGVDADPATTRDRSTHRFRFHPIYDWSYRDVWKAIYDNDWAYNRHYDQLFQRGVPVRSMRVSNYHHDQALSSLHWLQEIEPETWEAATRRLKGISTYGHLKNDQYPKSLPYMFSSWQEYMHHLIDNLIPDPDERPIFYKQYETLVRQAGSFTDHDELAMVVIKAVISGDYYGTQHRNFLVSARGGRRRMAERAEEQKGAS